MSHSLPRMSHQKQTRLSANRSRGRSAIRSSNPRRSCIAAVAACITSGAAFAGVPSYSIVNLGIVNASDSASQGFRVSDNGIATGRSFGNPTQAFTWTEEGGLVGLPNLTSPSRPFSVGNGVNTAGVVVGTGSTTSFGSNPLPLVWEGGAVAQLPLPAGHTAGRANDVNNLGVAVGSAGGGSAEVGVIYQLASAQGEGATVIATTTPQGSFLRSAFGINDSGRIVGQGVNPNLPAVNVGFIYDSGDGTAFEMPPLRGHNGCLAFDVSQAGHVVGSSMLNQGSGTPCIWSESTGTVAIPLPPSTSQGSARGVNSAGWVVGNAGGVFSVPWLWDGTTTYALADLLPPASEWDLDMNTSSSALGISEDGVIVGTGVFQGLTRAYALIPVDTACTGDLNGDDIVDGADLAVLLGSWGPARGSVADLNEDGDVNGADLAIMLGAWGDC